MGKGRAAALLVAVAIIGLALMRTATASHDPTHKAFSGGTGFKGLVVKTDTDVQFISSVFGNWTTVDSRGFQIPAGESQLVVVDFFAETQCSGTGVAWCSARILVGRTLDAATELEPAAGGDFHLDDTAGDGDGVEGHSMSQALCVRNATASPLDIGVWLQATRTSSDVTSFSIDDWTLKIARNAPCSPSVNI